MSTVNYPEVNGIRYDWSSIEITTAGDVTLGLTSIDYASGLEPGEVRTNHNSGIVAFTRGQQKPECSFEMHKVEFDNLITKLVANGGGRGYHEVSFDLTCSYADFGQPTITDKVFGARIKKASASPKEGNEAPKMKVELAVKQVSMSGLKPTSDALFQ